MFSPDWMQWHDAAETWLDTAAGNHRFDLAGALPDHHHQLWVCLDPGDAEKRDLANGTAVCDLPDCQSVVYAVADVDLASQRNLLLGSFFPGIRVPRSAS